MAVAPVRVEIVCRDLPEVERLLTTLQTRIDRMSETLAEWGALLVADGRISINDARKAYGLKALKPAVSLRCGQDRIEGSPVAALSYRSSDQTVTVVTEDGREREFHRDSHVPVDE